MHIAQKLHAALKPMVTILNIIANPDASPTAHTRRHRRTVLVYLYGVQLSPCYRNLFSKLPIKATVQRKITLQLASTSVNKFKSPFGLTGAQHRSSSTAGSPTFGLVVAARAAGLTRAADLCHRVAHHPYVAGPRLCVDRGHVIDAADLTARTDTKQQSRVL